MHGTGVWAASSIPPECIRLRHLNRILRLPAPTALSQRLPWPCDRQSGDVSCPFGPRRSARRHAIRRELLALRPRLAQATMLRSLSANNQCLCCAQLRVEPTECLSVEPVQRAASQVFSLKNTRTTSYPRPLMREVNGGC